MIGPTNGEVFSAVVFTLKVVSPATLRELLRVVAPLTLRDPAMD